MEKIKVSIIIPIYNTGIFLHRCISSVLKQSLKEIEVLLIDDGSTDASGEVCDLYASQDNRVRVIHKENEGVSEARNTGLMLAKGEYIGFVDSDDWIEAEMYRVLFERANQCAADVVMCDAITVYDNKNGEKDTFLSLPQSVKLRKEEITPTNLREIAGAVWRGIYRRKILQENQTEFLKELPLSEDRLFNLHALGHSMIFCYVKEIYYNRYIRKGSAINKYYPNMLEIAHMYRKEVLMVLNESWNYSDKYIESYNQQFLGVYFSVVYNLYHADCKMTYKEKRKQLHALVSCQDVIGVLEEKGDLNIREKLLKKKRIFGLMILGRLFQLKQLVGK